MWLNLEIDCSSIKRETEKAYELICPPRSRYEGYRFWIPKKWLRVVRYGGLEYAQVSLNACSKVELKCFVSRRKAPLVKVVDASEVVECFRMEQERIGIRKQHMLQNQQADFLFENEMRNRGF